MRWCTGLVEYGAGSLCNQAIAISMHVEPQSALRIVRIYAQKALSARDLEAALRTDCSDAAGDAADRSDFFGFGHPALMRAGARPMQGRNAPIFIFPAVDSGEISSKCLKCGPCICEGGKMADPPPDSLPISPAAGGSGGYRIAQVTLDEATILWRNADVEQERRVAIYDLIEENSFKPLRAAERGARGPYHLHLSVNDGRLAKDVSDGGGQLLETLLYFWPWPVPPAPNARNIFAISRFLLSATARRPNRRSRRNRTGPARPSTTTRP